MPESERVAVGAACVIFDGDGRVLLVRHTYGRLNWELPGGGAESGEAPDEAAKRELLEETGLRFEVDRLTGVYFEDDDGAESIIHFVFECRWHDRLDPVASSPEVDAVGYWPLDGLPKPISDFTERRIRDATGEGPARVRRVNGRQWLE